MPEQSRQRSDWFEQVVEIKELRLLVHLVIDETRCIVFIPYVKQYHLGQYEDLDSLLANSQGLDICDRLGKRLLVFLKE